MKLTDEKLTALRRQMFAQATVDQKAVLKGSRWLLMKNPENLNEQRDEEAHLKAALDLNEPLAKAYYLKDKLRLFWDHTFRWPAQLFLRSWCDRAKSTSLARLITMANTWTRLEKALLSYFKHRISSGPMEAPTTKSKRCKGNPTASGSESILN